MENNIHKNTDAKVSNITVPNTAFVEEQMSCEIEKGVQVLTVQKKEALINPPIYRTMDTIEEINEIDHSETETNSLVTTTILDMVITSVAVVLALRSEVFFAQNIFENVLKLKAPKSMYTALGITVLFFTAATVLKPKVKKFLQSKRQRSRFFTFLVFMSCVVFLMFGALNSYNIAKKNTRASIVLLSTQLDSEKGTLEDDPTDEEALKASNRLETQIQNRLNEVNTTPNWIKNIALIAMALLGVMMLICSGFLKAVFIIYLETFIAKTKREFLRKKMYRSHQEYKTMVTRMNDSYELADKYITYVIRKSAIEELLALVPSTQEYRATIKNRSHFSNGITTHHKTINRNF